MSLEDDLGPGVTIPNEGTVLTGIGDEVLAAGGCTLALILTIVIFLLKNRTTRQPNVHPDQAESVETTRREMGMETRQESVPNNATDTGEQINCPICLNELTHFVETNCGHVFCAQCILAYWQYDQWPRPARCAVCRRPVTLLLPSNSLRTTEGRELWVQVSDYNRRMSGQPRPFMHYLYDVPTLLRHLWHDLFTVRGLILINKLHLLFIFVFLLLYCLSPLDLIPEAVVGVLGLVDDFIIIVGALVYITLMYRTVVARGDID